MKINGVISDINEALSFTVIIVATIRTEDEEAVYSRLYSYPMGVSDFVNNEVGNLLRNNIIRLCCNASKPQ